MGMNKINDKTHAGKKTLRLKKQMKLLNPYTQDELVKNRCSGSHD